LGQEGQWFAAAAHLGQLCALHPAPPAHLRRHALCRAGAGQDDAYRQACAALVRHLEEGPSPLALLRLLAAAPDSAPAVAAAAAALAAERSALVRACLLRPGALPAPERLLPLVPEADALTRAAVLCRAGRHEEALHLLAGRTGPVTLLYRALAEHGCGRVTA